MLNSRLFQQTDRMNRDADTGADVVHLLVRLALDRDSSLADAHHGRETLADQLDAGPELRTLAADRRVNVADAIARGADLLRDGSQELGRIDVLPLRIRVGKMRTYVPERRRAEQRVDDRVDEDIRVGMSGEAGLAGKLDSDRKSVV